MLVDGKERNSRSKPGIWGASGLILGLMLGGCGGGSGGVTSTPAPPSAPTPTPTPTPTPPTSPAPSPAPAPAPPPTPIASDFETEEYYQSDGPEYHNAINAYVGGATGAGVTIGVIDSGIDVDNPEFDGRIHSMSADLVGNRGIDDADGHGTDVSLVAAAAKNDVGIHGIAFDASILALRIDEPGSCNGNSDDDCAFLNEGIAAGLDRAVSAGARVVNMSLGGANAPQQVRQAVIRAAQAGLVIVISAGNDGAESVDVLAADIRDAAGNNAIIVGSVDQSGVLSSFSNRAGNQSQYYITARGERICCVYEDGDIQVTTENGQQYITLFNGTSFAAPQVSGAVALIAQAFPNLTGAQIVDLLLSTARDAGTIGTDSTYGRGILDLSEAFQPQGAMSFAGGNTAATLGDETAILSAAMGDAGPAGLPDAIVLDGYARAFTVDLAQSIRNTPPTDGRLTAALTRETGGTRGWVGPVAYSLSYRAQTTTPFDPLQPLSLTSDGAQQARALAGRIVASVAPGTRIALGLSENTASLTSALDAAMGPAFLTSRAAAGSFGFLESRGTAFALEQRLAGGKVRLAADAGEVLVRENMTSLYGRTAEHSPYAVHRFTIGYGHAFGPLATNVTATLQDEAATVLGAHFDAAFGGKGAQSLFADLDANWRFAPRWSLSGEWREGWTRANRTGMIAGSDLRSRAWSITVQGDGVFAQGDALALRLAQPLRVESGGLTIALPTAYDYASQNASYENVAFSLTPTGREQIAELAWQHGLAGGWLSANLFYRAEPGHFEQAPDDIGAAFRFNRRF